MHQSLDRLEENQMRTSSVVYEYPVLLAWRNWMFTPSYGEVILTEDNTIEIKVQEAVKI